MTENTTSLSRRKRLRVGWRGVRRAVRDDGRSPDVGDADADVFDLVSDPWTSVEQAHDALTALERLFRERGDRRAVFLTVYGRVTDGVSARIDDEEFADPAWVADYLAAFADRYRQALLAFERPDATPPRPWRIAFESAVRGENLVLQDAFLGINAHVLYDLPLVLHEVGIDANREAKYEDHRAVNEVLRGVTNDVERLLAETYAPGIADLDADLGALDETFSHVSLAEGREFAWDGAVALTDSPLGVRATVARWVVWAVSTGAADLVLTPDLPPDVMDVLREVEQDGEWPGGKSEPESGTDAETVTESDAERATETDAETESGSDAEPGTVRQ